MTDEQSIAETDQITHYQAGHRQNIRGACHHKHRTGAAAQECVDRDQRECASMGGGSYSDRRSVYAVHADGSVTEQ